MNWLENLEKLFTETEKRPFDMYVLGPFLIWYGLNSKSMNKWPRRLLVTAGIYQLFYNWNNYRKAQKALLEGPENVIQLVKSNVMPENNLIKDLTDSG